MAKMNGRLLMIPVFIFLFLSFGQKTIDAASGQVFTVNSTNDTNDAAQGDGLCADSAGNCTLRAAVQEANLTNFLDIINFSLPTPSIINLTLGQLVITRNLDIVGPSARKLTVQRSPAVETANFRIFSIDSELSFTGASISGLTIANGNAGSDLIGGAVYVRLNNYLNLRDITIKNNTAALGGGIANSGKLYMIRSTLSGNSAVPNVAGNDGGGLYNQTGGRSDIDNSTISDNTANSGGGIINYGIITFNNATVSHNTASNTGGGILTANTNSVYPRNTIFANNAAGISAPNISGAFNSYGNNLIGDATGGTGFMNGVADDIVGTNASPVDPLLGALQNNGGQTDTRAIHPDSPAVNRGNDCVLQFCPSLGRGVTLLSDQRSFHNRGILILPAQDVSNNSGFGSRVDIGAFEDASSPLIYRRTLESLATYPSSNRRLPGAIVSFTRPDGQATYTVTNPFGYFRMKNLIIGEYYIIQIKSKGRGDGLSVLYPEF